jgi:hypothetical protein
MRSWPVILFLSFLCTAPLALAQGTHGVSKRGTTAAPFLTIPQGAAALGMGGAFVAVADDPSAMYWNPAGVADLAGIQLFFDHSYWVADLKYDFVGATVNAGGFGTLGLNVIASNSGDMKVTTVDQQEGTGELFSTTDVAVGITYAVKLTDNFSIGLNPKVVYQKIWKMSAAAFAIDVGMKYVTPFEGVVLGMSMSNFGSKMQMAGNNALVVFDPDPENSGNNGRIPAYLETEEWDLPLNFRVGLSYDLPLAGFGRFRVAADACHPSDNYESVNVGGELSYDETLFLRGGYKTLFLKDSEERFTLGVGFRKYIVGNFRLSLDYAYQDFARLKNVQKLTLGVMF